MPKKKKNKALKIYNGFNESFVKIGRAKDFLFDFIYYCNNYGYDLNTSSVHRSKQKSGVCQYSCHFSFFIWKTMRLPPHHPHFLCLPFFLGSGNPFRSMSSL